MSLRRHRRAAATSHDGRRHVWIINQYAKRFPAPGGTRHHSLAMGLVRRGMDATIIAARADDDRDVDREPADGVRFTFTRVRPYVGNGLQRVVSMVGFALGVLQIAVAPSKHGVGRPDVIVGSTPHPFAALAGWVAARRFKVPFILEVRDLWPESMVAILGVSRWHPFVLLLGAIEKHLYRRSDHIIGVLDGVADHARMRVGTHAAPTTCIPNGVMVSTVASPSPARDDGDEFRVIYTGAHGPPNSLDTLLRAAELLEKRHAAGNGPTVRFDLYGDGAVKNDLVHWAAAHQLESVHFHDRVPKTDVYPLLDRADATVLLLPRLYLWRFGISPNKLFDYLAARRPVVLAVNAPDDPVQRAGAGMTVAPQDPVALADGIVQLASTPIAERRAMGDRGRAYVEANHDMQLLGDAFADLVDSIALRR